MQFVQTLKNAGIKTINAAEASDWYTGSIKKLNEAKNKNQQSLIFKKNSTPQIGSMFMFSYDPKLKSVLPYYDRFPLVFPVKFYSDGFLGVNLHYLPPGARIGLLNALMNTANNDKYDDTTKLLISYDILNTSSNKFKGFENCVKRYLFSKVRSSFHYVSPSDWEKVASLPLQGWVVNPNKKYAGSPPY